MIVEVIVSLNVRDRSNFRFKCDKVIDGTQDDIAGRGSKLVLMRNEKTIAVFRDWILWRMVDDRKA